MGVQLRFGTAGATGGGWSAQPGTLQPAYGEQRHTPYWGWQKRTLRTRKDPMGWYTRWSYGCRTSIGSPIGSDGACWMDLSRQDWFNPAEIQDGCQTLKWIKGMCVDTSDVPISGANVVAFRSSDNTPGGSAVQSREDGSYDAPTPYVGVDHYVRAYIDGSPDRGGTTLDTLTPTNIDGT